METGSYCAYNVSRNVLLSEHVMEASEDLAPAQFLALLLNGPGISEQVAVWLKHFSGAMEWPRRLFAFDVVYLGEDHKILATASVGPGTEFPQSPDQTASILFLPDRRLEETSSTRGNVVKICARAELAAEIEPTSHPSDSSTSTLSPREVYLKKRRQNQPDASLPLQRKWPSEFVFEPFAGSLVHFPEAAAPVPQSSEYFLRWEVLEKPTPPTVQESQQADIVEEVIAEPIRPQLSFKEELAEFIAPETERLEPEFNLEVMNASQTEQEVEQEPAASSLLHAAPDAAVPELALTREPLREIAEPGIARKPSAESKQEKLSSAIRFRRWLEGGKGSRTRRSRRFNLPGLVAFYWSGGAPKPHEIVNISKTGFYLRTKDIWLPDTLVRMTLERPDSFERHAKLSIGVLARVVRIDEDGVGHEFVTTEALLSRRTREILPEHGTSKKELEEFLDMR